MTPPSVIIADDDRHLVELLETRCRRLGFNVQTAFDAMDALLKINREPPDVVILDVNMPSGGGLNLREMMVENPKLQKIPVIILTGRSDRETIKRCHNSCAYYVAKCPDIWQRVEPLLHELCQKVESQTAAAPQEPAAPVKMDSTSRIDTIFAALGWDESFLETLGKDSEVAQDEAPWVLCIDDDDEFSAALRVRLEQQGVKVIRAAAGMAGYRHAFTTPAQAIILDFRMPDGNGDYVLRRLKENPVTKDIPVIVLTGEKNRALERTMFNLGAAEYLTKPYTWDTLWAALRRAQSSLARLPKPTLPRPRTDDESTVKMCADETIG